MTACSDPGRSELKKPRVSVVIPVFNSMPELVQCLEALFADCDASAVESEVIIVDNGSVDDSWEYIQRLQRPDLHLLRDPDASIGALRNQGAAEAKGEVLCFLDSDCIVVPGYVDAVTQVLSSESVDCTGSKVGIPQNGTWVERAWYDLHKSRTSGPVPYINSGNLAVSRAAFESVGGFRTDLVSGEDAELGQRLTRAGFRIVAHEDVGVIHLGESKTIQQFLKRQTWHGVGMFSTARTWALDKPVVMLCVHVTLLLLGFAQLLFGNWSWPARMAVLAGLLLAVPAASVGYRYLKGGGGGRPLREVFLYFLYFFARLRALGIVLVRGGFGISSQAAGAGGTEEVTKSFRSHRK
jgi:GT2 family glycosyltransferase